MPHLNLDELMKKEKIGLNVTKETEKLFLKQKREIANSRATELEKRRKAVADEMYKELQNILITKGAELAVLDRMIFELGVEVGYSQDPEELQEKIRNANRS